MKYWLTQWNTAWRKLHNKKLSGTDWDTLFSIAATAEQQGAKIKKVM